jgi:ACS family glucarate transporter-like MFS transporter
MFFLLGFIESSTIAIICLFTAFFCCCSASQPAWSACIDIGGNNVGAVAGTMNAVGQTAGFVIGIVVGRLVHITHSYTSSLFLIAAVLIAGAMMWLLVDPTKKITTAVPSIKSKSVVPA